MPDQLKRCMRCGATPNQGGVYCDACAAKEADDPRNAF